MRGPSLRQLPLLVGAACAVLAALAPVSDSDLFWHLATGRDIATGGLSRADHFSWTVNGQGVQLDQWLGQLAIYLAYALGSWRGIVAFRAFVVGVLAAVVVFTALRERPDRPLLAVLASLPALALSRFAWTDRPELFGLACFAGCVALLRSRSDRALVATVPLLAVWANLHGSYALGLGLVLLIVGLRALREPTRRAFFGRLAVAAAVATLLTPSGPLTWSGAGGHFLAPPRYVQEESAPDIFTLPGELFVFSLLLVAAVALLSRTRDLREAALLVPVAFVSLAAARHLPFFPIAAAPYLVARTPEALSGLFPRLAWPATATRARARWDLVGAAVALVLLAAAWTTAPDEPDLSGYPTAALAQLPAGPGTLNLYDWGGFLIWYAPSAPVFIDGRLFPYVPRVIDDYRALIGLHPDWRDVLRRRGVTTILLRPDDALAVHARDLGWPVLASSDRFVLIAVR